MAKASFVCSKCGREFGMAAHLARHMSGTHGVAPVGMKNKKSRGRRSRGKVKLGRPRGRKAGRMAAVVSGLRLGDMSVDDLSKVIVAARDEVARRITLLQDVVG